MGSNFAGWWLDGNTKKQLWSFVTVGHTSTGSTWWPSLGVGGEYEIYRSCGATSGYTATGRRHSSSFSIKAKLKIPETINLYPLQRFIPKAKPVMRQRRRGR